ncbi:uncharacterized protein LOC128917920 [Rissa tridactyla]|uniref:uncharacterized protein LOC128917920 n=1 Tax=Rissa tridactyla TaxID=75485 RepID=UPI0023BA51D6|nr:uncharacterized protein LOC128917920 [Rissa tridactyla]
MLSSGVSNSDISFDKKARKMIKRSECWTRIGVTGQFNARAARTQPCTAPVPSYLEQKRAAGANKPADKARRPPRGEIKTCITHQHGADPAHAEHVPKARDKWQKPELLSTFQDWSLWAEIRAGWDGSRAVPRASGGGPDQGSPLPGGTFQLRGSRAGLRRIRRWFAPDRWSSLLLCYVLLHPEGYSPGTGI